MKFIPLYLYFVKLLAHVRAELESWRRRERCSGEQSWPLFMNAELRDHTGHCTELTGWRTQL